MSIIGVEFYLAQEGESPISFRQIRVGLLEICVSLLKFN